MYYSAPGVMTAGQKTAIAQFLDLAAASLKDGYRRGGEDYAFTDDDAVPPNGGAINNILPGKRPEGAYEAPPPPAEEKAGGGEEAPAGASHSLPLAYLIDEEEDDAENEDSLEQIAAGIAGCSGCGLCQTRTNAVPGEGVSRPLVMVIGEGPGADEDESGRPFVGKAGRQLDRMLAAVGLSRDKNCYIANVVKCRPPGNRDPEPGEIEACAPFLERQINLLEPKIILCAGRTAARYILHTEEGINRLRGRFGEYPAAVEITETGALQSDGMSPIPVLPTYHPSAILRDESLRRPAFRDLKLLMAKLVSLDSAYAAEVKPFLAKYSGDDADFAARVREYLV